MAQMSSPTPNVIIAKVVPDFLVVTQPITTATSMLAKPPTMGIRLTGMASVPLLARFSVCIAKKEPIPEYTA